MEAFLIVWVAFAAGIAALADSRGRSAIGYALLSFFLSPIIALIVLLVTPNLTLEEKREEERRLQHERELESIKAIANATKPTHAEVGSSALSLVDELEKLASLRDRGILTEDEFLAKKKAILTKD